MFTLRGGREGKKAAERQDQEGRTGSVYSFLNISALNLSLNFLS